MKSHDKITKIINLTPRSKPMSFLPRLSGSQAPRIFGGAQPISKNISLLNRPVGSHLHNRKYDNFQRRNFFNIVPKNHKGVRTTVGFEPVIKDPGIYFNLPLVQDMINIDMNTMVKDLHLQKVNTRYNEALKVHALIQYRVFNPTLGLSKWLPRIHEAGLDSSERRIGPENWVEMTAGMSIQTALYDFRIAEFKPYPADKKLELLLLKLTHSLTFPDGIEIQSISIKDIRITN